ncbi:MAG: hydrogenase maturation protein, partial [bacterium]|nr:hydrogenase maturation protein [bacterium]
MRILLLCHAFNCLTQRLFVELQEQLHDVTVEFDINDENTQQAIELFQPELIIAPYLKRA